MPLTLDSTRLRAPSQDGGVLIEPAFDALRAGLDANRTRLAAADLRLCGLGLAECRRRMRRALGVADDQPLVVIGHQPEFLHCGVWAKQVVCHLLAGAAAGRGLHFWIDHDQARHAELLVPWVQDGRVQQTRLAPREWTATGRYEELPACGPAELGQFRARLERLLAGRMESTPLPRFLEGLEQAPATGGWVDQFAAGIRAADGPFGIAVPQTRASSCDYRLLFGELLSQAARFAESYNRALAAYRRRHAVKSASRPMPDLAVAQGEIELPYWFCPPAGGRQRLYAAPSGPLIRLRAGGQDVAAIPAASLGDPARAEACLAEVSRAVRPRALTFTLWARLLVADMFIHGLGGALYDRITDDLIRDLWGIEPPVFGCVTATRRLSLPRCEGAAHDLQRARSELRELEWNPQRHLDGSRAGEVERQKWAAVAEARRMRQEAPWDHRARRRLFLEIREANRRLAGLCSDRAAAVREHLEHLLHDQRSAEWAASREYFYCLFPERDLADLTGRIREQCGK